MDRIGPDSTRSLPIRGAPGASGLQVPGLRNGASILFKALSPSSEGRWTVLVNGVRLDASVSTPLKPGLLYAARALALPDRPGWTFRVQGPAGEGRAVDFLRSSGLPGDSASILALRALMAERLSLDPRDINRLRSALLKKGASEERAALLARALAKGLDPEAYSDALDAAAGSRDGKDGGDGGDAGHRGGPGPGGEENRRGGGGSSDSGESPPGGGDCRGQTGEGPEERRPGGEGKGVPVWKTFPEPEGEDPEGLRALADLLRTLSGRSGDRPDPRQVFNARSGPRGRWIYVPYRFERGGVAFSGTLRILISEEGPAGAVLSADVRVEGGGRIRDYEFDLRGGCGALRLAFSERSGGERFRPTRSLGDLERGLAELGCRVSVPDPGEPVSEYPAVDDHA